MLKRQFQEEVKEAGSGFSYQGSKRRPPINNWRNVTGGLSPDEFASLLEPLFRKVMFGQQSRHLNLGLFHCSHPNTWLRQSTSHYKYAQVSEEVELVMSHFPDPSLSALSNPVGTSETSSLRLQFVTKLRATIFTGSQIEAEDGTPLKIELVDGRTNERVANGSLSSIKIEIVVLDGDFGSDEGEYWTEKEFNRNIAREREGKRPLITGELTVILHGGIGCLRNLIITDNSSWMRSRKFRLGARVVQKVCAERIREARSEAFVVKDHRGELNKKHYPPSLSDEVWRLEKVAKGGALHKRMTSRGISSVQDFLQLYEADASYLRDILGNGIANRIWETIVRHASTCVVKDNKMYAYCQASNEATILFNSVMTVAQATLDGKTYLSLDQLTPSQKILVRNLKRQAYYNKNQWVPVDAPPSVTPLRGLTNFPTEPFINLSPPLDHIDYRVPNQGIAEAPPELNNSLASTSHCCNVRDNRQLDYLGPPCHIITKTFNPTEANSLARQELLSGICASESSHQHHPRYSRGPFVPSLHLAPESPIPGNLMWTPEQTFVIESSNGEDLGIVPSGTGFGVHKTAISRPRASWCKIRAVVKWGTVWREVAARRTAMFSFPHY